MSRRTYTTAADAAPKASADENVKRSRHAPQSSSRRGANAKATSTLSAPLAQRVSRDCDVTNRTAVNVAASALRYQRQLSR